MLASLNSGNVSPPQYVYKIVLIQTMRNITLLVSEISDDQMSYPGDVSATRYTPSGPGEDVQYLLSLSLLCLFGSLAVTVYLYEQYVDIILYDIVI